MKTFFSCCTFFLLFCHTAFSQHTALKPFPLDAVDILDGPFRQAQQADLRYMLALGPDRLLAPYLREAGITPKAKGYGNWEGTGLDGHIGGHYLSALANMYAATGNKEVLSRLNYMIGWLDSCQKKNADGYIGGVPGGRLMWQDISKGIIKAGSFSLNDKWVPWYNIHKLYAGLADVYFLTGNENAKRMLIKLTDWAYELTRNLPASDIQNMLRSEHGGMNEVFANVFLITSDKKYLELARRFSHLTVLDPLLQKRDVLNGMHANTQIPKVIGFKRIAELAGDTAWAAAAKFFWETVVEKRTVSIGGNSVREHFNPATNFSSMIESVEGPETCNSYNMLKLTKQLFLSESAAKYMDYYERTLYNHILSSQHPEGGFVYFTPMRPGHYRVYSQPDEGFWCCVGSGLENHGKYGEMIYAHDDENIFVNLFIPSRLQWKEKGITLIQNTQFPFREQTEIKLQLTKSSSFALHFRAPSWLKGGNATITVNKKNIAVSKNASGYYTVHRAWKTGDIIAITLPMQTRAEYLPDGSSWVSFVHGPVVLAAVTDTANLVGLRADASRMGHIANGPLYSINEAPAIVTSSKTFSSALKPVKNKPLHFTASELIFPSQFKTLALVPFFQVHDARYMIYWPVTTAAQFEERQRLLKETEAIRRALELQTVDKVTAGEQQPESDHFFKGDRTDIGISNDRHWRNASGWFSYQLNNKNNQAKKLRLSYEGGQSRRSFDIYINDKLFKQVTLDGSNAGKPVEVDYDIPQEFLHSGSGQVLNIKFAAKPNAVTANIYEVRLMK